MRWFHSKRREARRARVELDRQLASEGLAQRIRARARTEGVSPASEPGPLARAIATLAERDRDILILLSEGRPRPEIARALWRDEQTIKNDLERILSCFPEEDAEALRGVVRSARKRQTEKNAR